MEIGGVPLYVRLSNLFRDNIAAGRWPAGSQIPTIPELCEEFRVARVTVRQALQALVKEGLLTSTRGRGTFVDESRSHATSSIELRSAINDPLRTGPSETMKILRRQKARHLPAELATDSPQYPEYMRIHKIHCLHGKPFQVVDTYVAAPVYARFPKGADAHSKTARLLRDHGGVQISLNRQELTIAYADPIVAQRLDCTVGSVLVRVRRWRADEDGRIVYAAVNLYRGDRFVLDIQSSGLQAGEFAAGMIPSDRPEDESSH